MSADWHALMRSREPWASFEILSFPPVCRATCGPRLGGQTIRQASPSELFISILIEYASTTATHSTLSAMSPTMALERRA